MIAFVSDLSDTLDRLRQPQYTGENRCLPCTVVNTLLAFVLAAVVAVFLTPVVGVLALALGLAAIYLRGYLVPGTPELTKRYFPDWLLARFDKESAGPGRTEAATDAPVDTDPDAHVDPEEILSTVDAVEPCADEDDLCLTDSFAGAWHDEMRRLRDETARREALAELFETDAVSVESSRDRVSVSADDVLVARWPSEGALVADLAADEVLVSRAPEWASLAPEQRFGVLAGLRSFLDTCPVCESPIELTEDTVESCCRSWEVLSIHCSECESDLLELDPETLETVA
jgi:hypothetical protein